MSIWDKVLTADEILKYTFSALNGNESGLVNYWNFNQGSGITITDQTSNGNNGTINGATWSTTTLSLFQHNCITSDTIYVESNSNPTISVSSDQTICAGESATITASGASTYSWSTGETSTSINVSPSANTEYVVTGTDANGCTAKDTVSNTVNPQPIVDIGNDTTSICQGDSVLLDAGSGHTNYLWSTGDTTQTIYASNSGNYSVTAGNGTAVSNSNSLSFDGQDDYAFIPDSPDLNFGAGDITYECWVKLPQTNHSMQANIVTNYITNTTPLFGLYVGGTTEGFYEGRLGVHYRTNQANSETNCISTFRIDDNLWHHVAAVKNSAKDSIYLYIDGVLNNREIVIIGDNDTYQGIVIGGNHLNRYLNSNIIQLSAWNRALTQSEIRSHMSCPPTGNETSLVGYWNFNEGSGNTVTDLTSNGNNGTINGASWSTQTPNQYCNNCTATDSVYVQVQAPATLDLGSDTTLICAGTSETLDAGTGFSSYSGAMALPTRL